MYVPLVILLLWLSRVMKFAGNWVLFTSAILLFSLGMLVQYRLYSDPEYNARNKAAARQEKMEALRTRYILENYDPAKKQIMGLPATPARPIEIDQLNVAIRSFRRRLRINSSYTVTSRGSSKASKYSAIRTSSEARSSAAEGSAASLL